MSRCWKHSDLIYGEDLILPDDFFEVPATARERMLYCRYYGETETGIIIEIQYKKGFCSEEPLSSWRVQKFIDFGAIYCGQVKIYRRDKSLVTVEQVDSSESRIRR